MIDKSDIAVLVSSCDLYEDAWNPFFRLLQINWEDSPQKVFLSTERKQYVDSYFDVVCLHPINETKKWGKRLIAALNQIDSEFILFFLEDFFLENKVNNTIFEAAFNLLKNNSDIGVIKFIPNIDKRWYDDSIVIEDYFSPTPKEYKARSNLMVSLYRKDYFLKLLRSNETPWDFEKFGTYRSRRLKEKILVQNDLFPLAFPYNYQIKYGYGITKRKWLKNNKELFEKNRIKVNFDRLGWYEDNMTPKKIVGLKRTKKEKLQMPFTNPSLFLKIVKHEVKQKLYSIKHFRNYF